MEEQTSQPGQGASQSPISGGTSQSEQADPKDVQDNKLWAILGYLGILCLIPLLAKKDSKFAQFHAKQGLILLIGEFFVWIPVIGWILGIGIFILWIIGIINVLNGSMKSLPIVGDLATKINI